MTPRPTHTASRSRRRQRGVALIAVVIALALATVMVNDFGAQTSVESFAAANARDQVKAHFLARSALEVSRLTIRLQQKIERQFPGVQVTDFADNLMSAFCSSGTEFRDFVGVDVKDVKGLGIASGGACGIHLATDDGKINVNCAHDSSNEATVASRLMDLYNYQTYTPLFEEEDAEGWRRTPEQQTQAIMDYIDADNARYGASGTSEDYGYEQLKDDYLPKNNYLDTIGELKLVRGIDDRFWTLFGDDFTVYGSCKLNLRALDSPNLIRAVIVSTAKDPNDPVLRNPEQLFLLASLVLKAKEYFFSFSKVEEFADFIKDPLAVLGAPDSKTGVARPPLNFPGFPPGTKIGVELDVSKLRQMVTVDPYRTYRITAWGEAVREQKDRDGHPIFAPIRRTITAVWDSDLTPQNVRSSPTAGPSGLKGGWAFLREE